VDYIAKPNPSSGKTLADCAGEPILSKEKK